jgi:hypothetical protein
MKEEFFLSDSREVIYSSGMPPLSTSWLDPIDLPDGGPIAAALDIELRPTPDAWSVLAAGGLFDCVPLGKAGNRPLVLRTLPDRPLAASPAAMLDPVFREQNLISDSVSELIPALVPCVLAHGESDRWDRIAGAPEAEWEALGELDLALGGSGDLSGLRTVLSSSEIRRGFCGDVLDHDAWVELMGQGFEIALREEPRRRLHRLIGLLIEVEWEDEVPDEGFGAFEPLAWSQLALDIDDMEDPLGRASAMRAVRVPASHETWFNASRHWAPDEGIGRSEFSAAVQIAEAFESWSEFATHSDPLVRAAVAHAEKGSGYSGGAHLEAVSGLAAQGDHPGAVSALLSASFWQRNLLGYLDPMLLHAFRKAAADGGFDAMHSGIDRMIHELDATS